jgi:hypothetical protein
MLPRAYFEKIGWLNRQPEARAALRHAPRDLGYPGTSPHMYALALRLMERGEVARAAVRCIRSPPATIRCCRPCRPARRGYRPGSTRRCGRVSWRRRIPSSPPSGGVERLPTRHPSEAGTSTPRCGKGRGGGGPGVRRRDRLRSGGRSPRLLKLPGRNRCGRRV